MTTIAFNVNGLTYVPNFVTDAQQQELCRQLDNQIWMTDLKRRVQHYGYRYDYRHRTVTADMHLGALPTWLQTIAEQIHNAGYMPTIADQCIINEYQPGQGISAHVDCEPCFGDVICSISLLSPCVMHFSHIEDDRKHSLKLEPGSMVVITGEARYQWKHATNGSTPYPPAKRTH